MVQDERNSRARRRYELRALAGEGGMAAVWRATMHGASGFSRTVAVKYILPTMVSNPDSLAMFIEEARVGSHLQHPNIVHILDFGVDEDGRHFLVMEWVDGMDLEDYLESYHIRKASTEWPLIAAIGIEVLRGLSAAHGRVDAQGQPTPVIHRDITPHNIMIGTNGVVKVTDFGLAKATDRSRRTDPDIVKGKLAYLAPELARGVPASIESDIFGVGVVLWEALGGRRLYEGLTDIDIFLAAKSAKIRFLGDIRSDLPRPVIDIVHKALCLDPAFRYDDALTMARSLSDVLRQQPTRTDAPELARSVAEARKIRGKWRR